jgi:hypothetical protein
LSRCYASYSLTTYPLHIIDRHLVLANLGLRQLTTNQRLSIKEDQEPHDDDMAKGPIHIPIRFRSQCMQSFAGRSCHLDTKRGYCLSAWWHRITPSHADLDIVGRENTPPPPIHRNMIPYSGLRHNPTHWRKKQA